MASGAEFGAVELVRAVTCSPRFQAHIFLLIEDQSNKSSSFDVHRKSIFRYQTLIDLTDLSLNTGIPLPDIRSYSINIHPVAMLADCSLTALPGF